MAEARSIYAVGGTVQASGGVYIERVADTELLQLCRDGKLGFVLSSRQVGKSSLMMHTAQRLEKEGIHSAIVDLSAIGVNVTVEQWYVGILTEIANSLGLQTDIFPWWEKQGKLGPAQRLSNFFRDVLLKEINGCVVLFFDEIDSTLSIAEKLGTSVSDDFFAALRATYNARPTTPDFGRLSFVLIGVASPSELISDNRRTPFNIGQRVDVTDFTLEEAQSLAEGLKNGPPQVLEWVFEWTSGHPYLTQRLCAALAQHTDLLTRESVAKEVHDIFVGESGQQDNNLQFVRDMLLKRATAPVQEVLSIYEQVLDDKKVEDDERSISKVHLKLAGVVRRSSSNLLRVSNQIYARVFNLQWVEEHLTLLRSQNPMQTRALDWEAANRDSSFLLRGKELAEAEQLLLRDQLPEVRGKRIVQEFVLNSKGHEERLREEQERRRRTQERIRNLALIVSFLVLVAMGVLASVALRESTNARNAESTAVGSARTMEFAVTSQIMALQTSNADSTRVANAEATSRALQGTATINAVSAALAQEEVRSLSKSLYGVARSRMDISHVQGLLLGVESFRLLENYDLAQGQYPDALPPLLDDMPYGLLRNLELSSGSVRKILYAPNGNLMVSMSDTVDLWNTEDPASPTLVTDWKRPNTSLPNDVAFSPNNKLMVIGYQDGRVELWSVSTPNVVNLATRDDFSSPVWVSVSPDNNVLAVAGDRKVRFWDITNPRSLQPKGAVAHPHEISDREMDVNYVSFAPGSTAPLLLSGGQDNYLSFWNLGKFNYNPGVRTGNPFKFDTPIPRVAISDKFLIIADTKAIRVFTYSNSGRELNDTELYARVHQGTIENLVIGRRNQRLYTTAQNGIIAEWDLTNPRDIQFVQTFEGPMQSIGSLAFHSEGNFLAVGGNNSTIAIWNLTKRNTAALWRSQILNDNAEIRDVAYSPDLNLLAMGDAEGSIVLWDVADPSTVTKRRSTVVRNPIRHIAFTPDNTALLFLGDYSNNSSNPAAYRRDLTRLDLSENDYLFGTDTADIFAIGNNYILAGKEGNRTQSIFSWDISTRPAVRGTAPLASTECPFFDTARHRNIVAVATCRVQVWDFSEGNVPTMITALESRDSRGMAFSAEGTLLVSANGNSTISIWKLNEANNEFETLPPISAHAGPVTSVAISPDGKTLASGGEDQDIILWDITDPESPSQRVVLKGHSSAILNGGIFFLPDGVTLISASKDEIILWNLDPQSWIDKACNLAGRNFTQSEWGQFVGRDVPYHATCPDLPVSEN